MTIDVKVGTIYRQFSGSDDLPEDPDALDRLGRLSVGRLAQEEGKSRFVIQTLDPKYTSPYLVGALKDSDPVKAETAAQILEQTGANILTVGQLVVSLGQNNYAKRILKSFRASNLTMRYLLISLTSPDRMKEASEVIKSYRASKCTVKYLAGILFNGTPVQKTEAKEILISYGRKVLKYLKTDDSTRYDDISFALSEIKEKVT